MSGTALPADGGLRLPPLSRRQFLAALGVAGATAVAATVPGLDWSGVPDLAETLVAPTFVPLVGQAFRFAVPGAEPVPLRLDAVDGVGGAARSDRAFTLRFSGPAAPRQGGEVGLLRARGLPPMPLLVVPNGIAADGRQEWTVTVVGEVL